MNEPIEEIQHQRDLRIAFWLIGSMLAFFFILSVLVFVFRLAPAY